MKSSIIILIVGLIFNIGCGIKGPPLPPIETVDDRLNSAQQVSGDSSTSTQPKVQPK